MNLQIKIVPAVLRLLISFLVLFTGLVVFAADKAVRSPEQLEPLLKRFPDADTDRDGKLTLEEARAYLRKMKSAKSGDGSAVPAAAVKPPEDGTPGTNAPAVGKQSPDKTERKKKYDKDAGPRPDMEDVPYGNHERLKLDLWKAKSDQPTPILVFFHGGGGDKLMYRGNRLLEFCLKNGVSVAAVNYRPNNQFPFPVPMQDAGRAIQFLRSKAGE